MFETIFCFSVISLHVCGGGYIAFSHYVGDMGNFILGQTPVANTDGAVFEIVL